MYLYIREAYGRDQIGLSRVEDKIALNFDPFLTTIPLSDNKIP